MAAPETVDSYLLVQNREDRLGRASQPDYKLALALAIREQGQAVTAENETTRYSLVGRVDYKLIDITSDEVISEGSVDNFTGYSATGSTLETLASERDARERLMIILADQLTTQLYTVADLAL
ncbi:MAG: LPS assembly lipoprotein LptE [Henriciella sp.]|nr:LPS assembly lipoprotein LptE [Henriciella sp.]